MSTKSNILQTRSIIELTFIDRIRILFGCNIVIDSVIFTSELFESADRKDSVSIESKSKVKSWISKPKFELQCTDV